MDAVLQLLPFPAFAVTLSVLAVTLLLRIWWIRTRHVRSTMDGPGLLLAAAVRGLPDERRDWGAAMMAELTHVHSPSSRWWFALGCARVALFPPRSSGLPVAMVGVLAAVTAVGTGLAVHRTLPAMQVFAVTFVALVGAFATLTEARSRRLSLAAPGVGVLVGVAGCIATTLYVVVKYPVASHDPSHVLSVVFAVLLTGYLWLALTPPRALTTNRWAGRLGVVTALALHLVIGPGALVIYASSTSDFAWFGGFFYGMGTITIIVLACSATAAKIGCSRRAGVVAALWAGMVSALLVFPVFMLNQLHGGSNFGAYIRSNWRHSGPPDLDTYLRRYVGEELGSCIVALVLFPALAVLLGLIGAAIGSATRRASPLASVLRPRVRIPPSRPSKSESEPMSTRVTRGTLTLVVALLVTVGCSKADDMKLWQGAFTTPTTWGAMVLTTTGEGSKQEVRLKFAPDGRPADSEVGQLKLSERRISFLATLAGKQYQFTGARRNDQWEGTLIATRGLSDRGTWRLALLDLGNGVSNGEDPLPAATGRYSTGRIAFHWVDETRPELETRVPEDRRELLVYVFYPSEANGAAPRAPYMPEADVMRNAWGDELTDRLKRIRAHSREGVALARGRERFPVVIFAPGNGWKALAYTTLLEDLASHGYVVAAIEPPYNAPAMQFPDGKVIGRLAPAERGWEQPKNRDDFVRNYQQRVVHWARDMSFVLDRLTALDGGDGLFSRRLDLARVGAFGHSRGGQVAGTVRLLDSRFRGGINLDGNMSGKGFQPVTGTGGGKQPFLWIEKQYRRPDERELQQAGVTEAQFKDMYEEGDRLMRTVEGGGMRVTIARLGIGHMDFSDNPFWNVSGAPDVRAGKLQTLAVTRGYVHAFFDGCLRGQWGSLRRLVTEAGKAYPEVSARRFGTMWPQ